MATVVASTRAAASSATPAVTYLAVPVAPPPAVGGVLTKVAGEAVTAGNDDWSALEAASTRPWLVEITTGAASGWWARVASLNTAAQTAVLAAGVPAAVQPGTGYRLRRLWTIGELFGAANAAVIDAAASPSDAETLVVVHPGTHAQRTFFRSNVAGHAGWHDAAFAPADDAPLLPGQAVIVNRRSSDARAVAFSGVVRNDNLALAMAPGVSAFGAQIPGPGLALAGSGLLAAGFQGGASAATADLVIVPESDGSFTAFFFSTVSGSTGWKKADGTPAPAAALPADGAFLLRIQSGGAFAWRPPLVP